MAVCFFSVESFLQAPERVHISVQASKLGEVFFKASAFVIKHINYMLNQIFKILYTNHSGALFFFPFRAKT